MENDQASSLQTTAAVRQQQTSHFGPAGARDEGVEVVVRVDREAVQHLRLDIVRVVESKTAASEIFRRAWGKVM